jgi:hypothetical protein
MKKTISFFILLFAFSIVSYSQNSTINGSVILENGDEKEVSVSLQSKGEFTTLKVFDSETNDIEYVIGQIKEIRLSDGRIILTNQIEYNKNLNETGRKKVYMEEIIDGEASLYRIYDIELNYGINFQSSYKALQSIRGNGFENALYKNVFFEVSDVAQCEIGLEIRSSKDSRVSFIYLTNKINECLDPDYTSERDRQSVKLKHELGFKIGSNFSSIDFTSREGNLRYENVLNFKNSRGQYIGVDFNYSIFGEWLFLNTGLTYTSYSFSGDESDGINYNRPMEFDEFVLSGGIEVRKEFLGIIFAVGGGRNYHLEAKSTKSEAVIISYDYVRSDNVVFRIDDEIFDEGNMNSEYYSWYFSPSISREVFKDWIAGIQFKSIYRSDEVPSKNEHQHTDSFNFDYTLAAFVRYRIFTQN